jgi:hypothetical protein
LRLSAADLHHPDELRELGMAVFIDRPLGVHKAPAEPDQTPLLSYEAFSRAIADQRLTELARDDGFGWSAEEVKSLRQMLRALAVAGIPVSAVGREARPVVSVSDALKVSEDFLLLRTLPRGVREFLQQYDVSADHLTPGQRVLLVRGVPRPGGGPLLAVYDAQLRLRMELEIDLRHGGLRVVRSAD